MTKDVSASIVDNLRQRGFDVLSARDASRLGLDDEFELNYAVTQRRTFLTHSRIDVNFEQLHLRYLAEQQEHCGITIAKRRSSDLVVVMKLLVLLDQMTGDDMLNQLRYMSISMSCRSVPEPSAAGSQR